VASERERYSSRKMDELVHVEIKGAPLQRMQAEPPTLGAYFLLPLVSTYSKIGHAACAMHALLFMTRLLGIQWRFYFRVPMTKLTLTPGFPATDPGVIYLFAHYDCCTVCAHLFFLIQTVYAVIVNQPYSNCKSALQYFEPLSPTLDYECSHYFQGKPARTRLKGGGGE